MSALGAADKLAIHELLARAAWAYDEKRLDVMEACFAPDARMGLRIATVNPVGPYEGRAAILELIRSSIASQPDQRRHVISNVFFEHEAADTAVVVSTLTLVATADDRTAVVSAGLYRDTVVRDPEGWRFRERMLSLDRAY